MEPHYITPADHIRRLLQDPMSTAALIRQVLDSALPLAEVAKGAELLITVEADEPFAFEALADVVIEMPAWSDWITRVAGRFDEGELRYVPISPDPELAEIVAMTPGGYSCVKIPPPTPRLFDGALHLIRDLGALCIGRPEFSLSEIIYSV